MDSWLISQQAVNGAEPCRGDLVRQRLETMKRCMPRTMECIEDRVKHVGPHVRALVRRALRGSLDAFTLLRRGTSWGTPQA